MENQDLYVKIYRDDSLKLVEKFTKVAEAFEKINIQWFDSQPLENGYRKTVHDHYLLAWDDFGVEYGIKKTTEMPVDMQNALFKAFSKINPDDDSYGNAEFVAGHVPNI